MRVIAGTLGGRRITAPPGRATRPTPERVREALFSALGDLHGARVLDLFAGSGALAIEAISRGAAAAVLVEHDRQAARVIRENLEALGIDGIADVRQQDAVAAAAALTAEPPFDLVLLDPPYGEAGRLGPALGPALPGLVAAGGRVVTESDRRDPIDLGLAPPAFERRYGDTLLRIFTP